MEALVAATLEILRDDVVESSDGKRTAERGGTLIDAAQLAEGTLYSGPGDPILG